MLSSQGTALKAKFVVIKERRVEIAKKKIYVEKEKKNECSEPSSWAALFFQALNCPLSLCFKDYI